ncbi:MAG: plastocyanin/azurin family copper-binding protein [Opitutales bacterium]
MKITRLFINCLAALVALAAVSQVRAEDTVKNVVIVADNNMKFSVTRIEARPGERIHVQLRNEGTMPKDSMGHNWILLQAKSDTAAFAMAAVSARDNNYLPKKLMSEVIASIPLLGPKEVGDVTFTCPTKPGKYPYICSCNGHSLAGMHGELIVK